MELLQSCTKPLIYSFENSMLKKRFSCRLFVTKPLSEPILIYYQLNSREKRQRNLINKIKNEFENIVYKVTILSRPLYDNDLVDVFADQKYHTKRLMRSRPIFEAPRDFNLVSVDRCQDCLQVVPYVALSLDYQSFDQCDWKQTHFLREKIRPIFRQLLVINFWSCTQLVKLNILCHWQMKNNNQRGPLHSIILPACITATCHSTNICIWIWLSDGLRGYF